MIDPLTTEHGVTKAQLKEWLEKSDTPDDAELDITYSDDGQIVLYWRWSFLAGAYGDEMVVFSKAESNCFKREIEYELKKEKEEDEGK